MDKRLIFSLLFAILMVTAPHAAHLPLWVSALCLSLFVWRAYLAYSDLALPPRALLTTITLAATGGILIEFHTLFGREAGVTLLLLLSTLKLMELRTPRDAMALIYLCCFIMITHFFYSQSLILFLYLLAALFALTQSWVYLHAPGSAVKPRLKIVSTLLLQAIPLAIILFILFPRIPGPLWGLPQDAFNSSGLDDKMSPGSLGRLALSDAVAFRVTYPGSPPPRDQMYWRGPSLWHFDGTTWTGGKASRPIDPEFTGTSLAIAYSVTLEANNKHWLFTLDMPEQISIPARLTDDFQLLNPQPVNERLRYEARSRLNYRANLHESESQRQRALQLPDSLNPKTRQLAAQWRASGVSDAQLIQLALNNFNRQNFHYTLDPEPLGLNGVDDFLFTTRQGFCEHYASAFVYLMRAAGIPARVVTGYQGGEYNAFGNYYIVRQSDAHAWAEVWLKDQGWTRIDPTAAIAPARVELGLSAALPATKPFIARTQWLRELRLNLDALSYQWNRRVVGYDSESQFAFMSRLGLDTPRLQQMGMATALLTVVSLFALLMMRHLFKRTPDQTQAAWLRLCAKLAKAGVLRAPHEGPVEFAARVSRCRPDLDVSVRDLAERYITLRYGDDQKDETARHEFIRRVARFHPSRRPQHSGDKSGAML